MYSHVFRVCNVLNATCQTGVNVMSGHSKWANTKHRKERQDAKKGKIFSKMAREIMVAAKAGGGDPETNARLRLAIDKARQMRVPADNIERAVQKGAGGGEGANLDEILYEGYGPGGVAVLLEIMTDNRNRTAAEVRHLFSKFGGNLGESGCVAWMFDRKGVISIDGSADGGPDEDKVMELALEAGAEDVRTDDGTFTIIAAPDDLGTVREHVTARGIKVESAEVTMVPQSEIRVEGPEAKKLLRLLDALEDHDDVQEIHANFTMDEEEMARLEA